MIISRIGLCSKLRYKLREHYGYAPAVIRILPRRGLPDSMYKIQEVQEYSIPWQVMLIIAFIEDDKIIQIILKHLGLWMTRNHDPPREKAIETTELIYDGQYAQVPLDVHWVQ